MKYDTEKPDPFEWQMELVHPSGAWQACRFEPHQRVYWEGLLRTLPLANQTLGLYEAMRYGEDKYSKYNWKTTENGLLRYQQAALRHAWYQKFYPDDVDGIDKESGLHHYSHAAASIAIVMYFLDEQRKDG